MNSNNLNNTKPNRELVRLSHSRFRIRKRTYSYTDDVTFVLSYPERLTSSGRFTTMHYEREVMSSDDSLVIKDEVFRLNTFAIKQYQLEKQRSAIKNRKVKMRIRRRKDKMGKLYNFIDRKFSYLFDVYHDLKPKDIHVTKRGRDFCHRSEPKSFASFVVNHLRKKDEDDKLQSIYTKAENLGLSKKALAAL